MLKKTIFGMAILGICFLLVSFTNKDHSTKDHSKKGKDAFITRWDCQKSQTIKIVQSLRYTGNTKYDFTIDWGDGVVQQNNYDHSYEKPGTYSVKITGSFPGFILLGDNDKQFITVEQWGTNKWETMDQMFGRSKVFKGFEAKDRPDLSKTYTMAYAFGHCSNFNDDISDWDVSNVQYMKDMFTMCWFFNQDLSKWDVSNLRNADGMFLACKTFNQNLSSWDVSKVENMDNMFAVAKSFDQDLSSWKPTKKVSYKGFAYGSKLKAEQVPFARKHKARCRKD